MDRHFMKIALEQSLQARGRTSPNPMVGAVIVDDGKIAGKGYHARAGEPHAEIIALRNAGEAAAGATLYVTLEPCCHRGKTGPCTEAIINAGIKRVVVAAADPNPLVSGRGIERLREAGIEVTTGVMEEEAQKVNEVFNKYIVEKKPFVIAKAAMSLDGKIATSAGDSQWITGPEAREDTHRLRDIYDAILVGIGTVLADNPSLTARPEGREGKDPARVVLDSNARTPPESKLLTQDSPAPTYIVTGNSADPCREERLSAAGAEVVNLGGNGKIDLQALLSWLGEKEITSLLVEGGAGVHSSFFSAGLVDKVVWYIAPKIIGGERAPGPVGGKGFKNLGDALHLNGVETSRCGEDLLVQGYPEHK